MTITKGIRGQKELLVTEEVTAARMGSGLLEVLATPAMIALAEGTAMESVQPLLEEGQGTVGTRLDIAHIAATPVGMTVRCETELVEVDRRRLVFSVKVSDDKELVGEGTHERFIIDNARFLQKAQGKRV
ncbi:MAG: thioesterase family protein [Lachnospiraceae bacterium]|nr:thioesterase family protein [Lachnospiraceae bacterium]